MKRLKTPQVLSDLYRDLRDRRLLIPLIGIVVAILAVPVLLAAGDEPAPAPAVAAPVEGATEVSAAVLAEQSGIRDYRERLGALEEQNPFDPKFKAPSEGADEEATSIDVASTSTDASASVGGTSTASPAPTTAVEPSPEPSASADTAPAPVTNEDNPNADGNDSPKPDVRFVVGRVDISFGPVGDAREINDVRELDFIPGDKNPVASFIGLAGNGDHALFGVAPSVVETRGDGSCSPKNASGCQFLRLAKGDARYLKTDGGATYKLKLVATHLVPVADPSADE